MIALLAALALADAVDDPGFATPPVAAWTARLPGGRIGAASHVETTSPVVVDEGIFVGSAAGRALFLVSRDDGALLRTYPAAGSVSSRATVVGDHVFFADTGGSVWCYTREGDEVWHHETDAPIVVEPVFADGRVFVANVNDVAVALDAATGALVWQETRRRDPSRASDLSLFGRPPALVDGKYVWFGFSDGTLAAYDAASGEEAWTRRVGEGIYPDLVAGPIRVGQDVVASGYFEPVVAIDVQTRSPRWRVDTGSAHAPLLGLRDGKPVIWHPGTDGKVRCIDAITGDVLWTWDSLTGGAITTPLETPAGLLVASSEGGLWLVNPASGEMTWTETARERLSGINGTPAIDGRELFFVTDAARLHAMVVPPPERPVDRGRWQR